MSTGIHILVVDDDSGLRDLLQKYLSKHGYRVSVEESASMARQVMELFRFDLLIVDVMMPVETGIEFTSRLRESLGSSRSVPILMLTAKGEGADRIEGFEAGVDDYLPKPFEPQELLLRIRAILRRFSSVGEQADSRLHFGVWVFDLGSKRLFHKDSEYAYLTEGEADLLHVLASRANEAVSREDIMRFCDYSDSSGEFNERAIDVQMTRLRRKIESDPRRPQFLMTVRNKGYLLRCEL